MSGRGALGRQHLVCRLPVAAPAQRVAHALLAVCAAQARERRMRQAERVGELRCRNHHVVVAAEHRADRQPQRVDALAHRAGVERVDVMDRIEEIQIEVVEQHLVSRLHRREQHGRVAERANVADARAFDWAGFDEQKSLHGHFPDGRGEAPRPCVMR
ncbi:Uncharacterised protein [Burkholderia mallei]|nr:hypothetical protein DM45_241 [Burkholderia mallei]KOT00798.1 hypothetical protein DM50_2588 [Burkholderia mallei]KOT10986.1 hypothetical protein DM56_3880 [Burkholderia mallei]KOT18182.1 hypothetical protein DM47_1567 [Burkholderia mallei]KOT21458.1 hypothetical protein DM52_1705 [Burkholderia mallei]